MFLQQWIENNRRISYLTLPPLRVSPSLSDPRRVGCSFAPSSWRGDQEVSQDPIKPIITLIISELINMSCDKSDQLGNNGPGSLSSGYVFFLPYTPDCERLSASSVGKHAIYFYFAQKYHNWTIHECRIKVFVILSICTPTSSLITKVQFMSVEMVYINRCIQIKK